TTLPRIESYFIGDHSQLWFSGTWFLSQFPMRHEHQMFICFGSFIALIYCLFPKNLLQHNRIALSFAIAVSIVILVTLIIGDFSLYRLLFIIPGVSAVSVVSGIILVLLFPIGFIVGYVIDTIALNDFKLISFSPAITGILCICIISDSILAHKSTTSVVDWSNRLQRLESKIVKPIEKDSILVVATQDPKILGMQPKSMRCYLPSRKGLKRSTVILRLIHQAGCP
ncbi:MAG: hypothetical protein ABSF52_24415, partial [Syntrophobacteraceae bacterium]